MSRPVTLVFLVDALGWEIAEHFAFGREQFAVRASLGTVLGYSAAAIPSLLSGTLPVEHGSWAMFRRAQGDGVFSALRWVPPLPHALDWRARRWIRRWVDRNRRVQAYYDLYEIPTHLLHRFDVGQTGDPFQPGGLARETVFDWMRAHDVRYRLWDYHTGESDNFAAAEQALRDDVDVLFVYTAELDALMHRVGILHPSVGARLSTYATFLSGMRRAALAHDVDLEMVLLSDHGMTDVVDVVDVMGEMSRRGLRVGRDYLGFFDSTMARVWGDERVAHAMDEAMGAHGHRLSAPQLRAFGCYFADGAYGDHVFLANPGELIVPSFMGSRRIAAMHGYHPEDRFSRGCFMSSTPTPPLGSILDFKAHLQKIVRART
ncbi:MAG TPA: alkaline phosphatase family protein [Candidatus Krumholzibacteria bacterium]|nr:alkaline phosphatase family protein [Candidatus Krumholzibacteria bacterium]